MQIPLVMTLIGEDRPGLVELVARQVVQHKGNWLESRMCRLGGKFAGLVRVEVPADQEESLRRDLEGLASSGLTVVAERDAQPADPGTTTFELARLEIVGNDRPGIVRQVTDILARRGVNLEELNSECRSAPMSGESIFEARARLAIPSHCDLGALRRELESVASDMMVEIRLQPGTVA